MVCRAPRRAPRPDAVRGPSLAVGMIAVPARAAPRRGLGASTAPCTAGQVAAQRRARRRRRRRADRRRARARRSAEVADELRGTRGAHRHADRRPSTPPLTDLGRHASTSRPRSTQALAVGQRRRRSSLRPVRWLRSLFSPAGPRSSFAVDLAPVAARIAALGPTRGHRAGRAHRAVARRQRPDRRVVPGEHGRGIDTDDLADALPAAAASGRAPTSPSTSSRSRSRSRTSPTRDAQAAGRPGQPHHAPSRSRSCHRRRARKRRSGHAAHAGVAGSARRRTADAHRRHRRRRPRPRSPPTSLGCSAPRPSRATDLTSVDRPGNVPHRAQGTAGTACCTPESVARRSLAALESRARPTSTLAIVTAAAGRTTRRWAKQPRRSPSRGRATVHHPPPGRPAPGSSNIHRIADIVRGMVIAAGRDVLGERLRRPAHGGEGLRRRAGDLQRRARRATSAAASVAVRHDHCSTPRSSPGSTSTSTRPTRSTSAATRYGREATISWTSSRT